MAKKKAAETEPKVSKELPELAAEKTVPSEKLLERAKIEATEKNKIEIIEKVKKLAIQPELNLALVGHVDHGKTTLTERLSGKWTDTHSEELKRGITIRLGYTDVVFYKCEKCNFYTSKEKCVKCNGSATPLRK